MFQELYPTGFQVTTEFINIHGFTNSKGQTQIIFNAFNVLKKLLTLFS